MSIPRRIARLWLRRLLLILIVAVALTILVHIPAGFVYELLTPGGRKYIVTPDSPVNTTWSWPAYFGELREFGRQLVARDFPMDNGSGIIPFEQVFRNAWANTVRLYLTTLPLGALLGVLLGSLYALRSRLPRMISFVVSTVTVSTPDFLLIAIGQVIVIWFYQTYQWRPWYVLADPYTPRAALMPMFVLTLVPLGLLARLTAAVLDETMSSDYIRTARSKGIPEWRVIFGHALKNALPRVLAGFPGALSLTVSSLLIVEHLTNWPGVVRWVVPNFLRVIVPDGPGSWHGPTPQIITLVIILVVACGVMMETLVQSLGLWAGGHRSEVEE